MSDKHERVKMAQVVAFANHPDMRRFPAPDHIAVKKEMKRNFRNLKEVYPIAVAKLAEMGRNVHV